MLAQAVLSFALVTSATASPIFRRQNDTATTTITPAEGGNSTDISPNSSIGSPNLDLTVVKFAALAENLEATFYDQALKQFAAQDFTNAGFVDSQAIFDQLSVILGDEQTHHSTLQAVAKTLGGDTSDVDSCEFDFSAALSDVGTFLATARVLEYVGIDAYIGGTILITDKALLVNAAEITTVEARHNTELNTFNGGSAIANAFDTVLTPQQVLSVAAPFISGGCDPVQALGLTPIPALTVTNNGTVLAGTLLTFGGDGLAGVDTSNLFCNMIIGGATKALSFPLSNCTVPDGIDGAVHLFVVNSSTPLSANIVNQDASIIVAGPAVTFIDILENRQSELLLGKLNSTSSDAGKNGKNKNKDGGDGGGNNGKGNSGGGGSGGTTIIIIEEIRLQAGVKVSVDGGIGGAVALGWL